MSEQTETGGRYSMERMLSGALTVEVHVPGVIAVLVLPNSLSDGANQRDGQQAAKQHQDLKVGDALHVGQLQRRPSGVLKGE